MATTRKSGKSGTRRRKARLVVQKARGAFHPRVQKVGPEHFGLVSVDCAKARSKFMVADFYDNILVPPTKAQSLGKAWRSLGSPTPDTAVWGRSPDVPVWRDGDHPTRENGS